MNIEQKLLEQIFDTLMNNEEYPNHFSFADDLRYDHYVNYNPQNPHIILSVPKEGKPTKYKLTVTEVEQ